MKKKGNIYGIIGIILILIGVIVISIALFMRMYSIQKQDAMINEFQKELNTIQQVLDQQPTSSIETNSSIAQDFPNYEPEETEPEKKLPNPTISSIGIMTIPKIDLKVAIGEGVDMTTLKYALGHFPNTAAPGKQGNFAVAGHRSYTYNKYFNRLDEMKIGDNIIVTSLDGEFTYKVDNIRIVEPEEVSVLNATDNSIITLVTCTPVRVATHRLIIKGTLIK